MSAIVIAGNTSGTVTLDAPDIAGSTVLTLPATSGTVLTTTGGVAPGTSGNALVSNGTSWTSGKQTITSGTAVTASGTSIDFTSIPSWVKRITVMFSGVSTNGTSLTQVQLGSGSFVTTGYTSASSTNGANSTSTTGLLISTAPTAADTRTGVMIITNISGNIWVMGANLAGIVNASTSGGSITLSGVLDRVRITMVNGTDTFDAGSINILYE